jgi:hypothetical protein
MAITFTGNITVRHAYLTYNDDSTRIEWPYTVTETFQQEVPRIIEADVQRTSQRIALRIVFSTEVAFDICEIEMPGNSYNEYYS